MGHARNNNLDFLRGLSVVLVILYHSKISINDLDLFKGGYLGVDIFFLLSGYFITKIIFEIQKDNFLKNILTFLLSRLRKLLPSIITLSLLIMFIGSFLIKPNKIDENVGFLIQGLFFL